MDGVNERMVEVLGAFYEHQDDGTAQTVAMFLDRDVDGPEFQRDLDKLCQVGALEVVDIPALGDLDTPEVYRVTLASEQLLREWWDYPVGQ